MNFIYERFEFIELRSVNGGKGVTVKEFARKFNLSKRTAATWLSWWVNHYNESRDIIQHMVKRIPPESGREGRYTIDASCDWWGELYFDSAKEDTYHDVHDTTGHKPIDVVLGEKTYTDSRYSREHAKKTPLWGCTSNP